MALVKPYHKHLRGLPRPPVGAGEALEELLHPPNEPSLDEHFEALERFDEWLQYPKSPGDAWR